MPNAYCVVSDIPAPEVGVVELWVAEEGDLEGVDLVVDAESVASVIPIVMRRTDSCQVKGNRVGCEKVDEGA